MLEALWCKRIDCETERIQKRESSYVGGIAARNDHFRNITNQM